MTQDYQAHLDAIAVTFKDAGFAVTRRNYSILVWLKNRAVFATTIAPAIESAGLTELVKIRQDGDEMMISPIC